MPTRVALGARRLMKQKRVRLTASRLMSTRPACAFKKIKTNSPFSIVDVFKQITEDGAAKYRVTARIAQFGKGVNQRAYP
jgi:hypothetical protein